MLPAALSQRSSAACFRTDGRGERARRDKAAPRAQGRATGTSDYPNLAERRSPCSMCAASRAAAPPDAGRYIRTRCRTIRLAEPFEALREASRTAVLKKTGARPKVFLANLGKLAEFTARAMFAQEFLRGRRHRGGGQ